MFSKNQSISPLLRQLVQFSIKNQSLQVIKQSHARVCLLGLHQHPFILTELVTAYSLSRNPVQSRKLFDSIHAKDVCLWNTLINGFVHNNLYHQTFSIFNDMCRTDNSLPDGFTFSIMAKVSGMIGDSLAGKSIHGKCIKLGVVSDAILTNSLISMYSKCDRTQESRKLFDEMPQRTISSWNIMLSGYVNGGNLFCDDQVSEFVKVMLTEGLKPNEYTLSNLLTICSFRQQKWDYGRELHCYIIRNEMNLVVDSSVHLDCCLIDMYSRCGKLNWARLIFDRTRFKNVFSWTAMMNGYQQNGDTCEAVVLFHEMQSSGVIEPNEVSLLTILPACRLVAGLRGLKQIHGFVVKKGFANHTSLCNSLIDLYSKSGLLNNARQVFENDCLYKDTISWSCMISGYGLQGKGQEAVNLYDKMILNGVKPDPISIVGVLSACSRSGLVEKGLDVYNKAISVFRIEPTLEMCSCIVDMLGRSGRLDEALTFTRSMNLEPGPSVWGALVNASALHANYELQVSAYESLIQIEPENPSNYVSLSNLYATSRKWDSVAQVRRMMKEGRLRKLPGCSWITINSETHSFVVADKAHPKAGKIYKMLHELIMVMKGLSVLDIKGL